MWWLSTHKPTHDRRRATSLVRLWSVCALARAVLVGPPAEGRPAAAGLTRPPADRPAAVKSQHAQRGHPGRHTRLDGRADDPLAVRDPAGRPDGDGGDFKRSRARPMTGGGMGLRIQNNLEAFDTHRLLAANAAAASKSMARLSSGYRINSASDDAAGLAISEKMRGQIGGLAQAQRNAQDAISLVQTAEGSLNEVHSMLDRIRDLKTQFDNGTLSSDDQDAIASEVSQIAQEIGNTTSQAKFNGKALFGSTASFTFQVGANDGETISMAATDMSAAIGTSGTGGLSEITSLTSASAAKTALSTGGVLAAVSTLDAAIKNVSAARSNFGAVQNRLEYRIDNLSTYQENLTAAESRIRDTDMAAEMTNFSRLQILQQAGTSMLAQANQAPQNILSLLR